jgi:hypothetical protein
MRRMGRMGLCLVAVCAISATAAATASAAEYELAGLPELGRCVKVASGTGTYLGGKCLTVATPGKGKFEWMPGPGANAKFTFITEQIVLQGTGAPKLTINCEFAEGEGQYVDSKTLTVSKLVLSDCKTPKKSESEPLVKTWCQNIGNLRGEVTAQELTGEIGYIVKPTQVGVDLKAKTGKAIAVFECGGASEVGVERGTGTGTLMEIEGSVIGRIKKINRMVEENLVTFKASGGKQVPEMFEGGVKDTLITNVGIAKTPEPTTLTAIPIVTNKERLEIKAR